MRTFGLLALLMLADLAMRAGWLCVRPHDAFSLDVAAWRSVAQALLELKNPYTETVFLNWPPLWMQIVYLLARAAAVTGIDFVTLLFSFLMATELMLLAALARLIHVVCPGYRWFPLLFLAVALDPITVFQTSQQGNFDMLLTLWITLFLISLVHYLKRDDAADWQLACLFLGIAILTKTIPMVLAPLLASGASKLKFKNLIIGMVLLVGPPLLGLSVIYVLNPARIWLIVINYTSNPGYYGITGLTGLFERYDLTKLYVRFFPCAVLGSMFVMTIALWRAEKMQPRNALLLSGLTLLSIPTFGTGFGPQYICWCLPGLLVSFAAFRISWWRTVLVVTWLIVIVTYCHQYLLVIDLGRPLSRMFPHNYNVQFATVSWSDRKSQAIARLPMFVACIVVLCAGVSLYIKQVRRKDQPSCAAAS